ncbi:lysM and putative peptidoglycan-binding domain-containing protein 3-like [Xyrauchen texanus]|uniref:lysM and putative peptidoglycan-binding domain-containing protein 3-like n=1 Tax=Xyrauchen texanus TaxID=154827 RepID=UPI002241C3F7|nr:lysM and putative peptidoglycan-binding domain-containing protein 3-like [Xyrauchen texanus]
MTGRNQHNGFQFATTVQPHTGGCMYNYGNNSETEISEEDDEIFELRSRGRERQRRRPSTDRKDDIVYLIRDIKEGDTLISISLQYFCTVADIKRANNLLTEQDFFALRSIRIPVRKFSSFTETHNTAPLKTSSPGGTRRNAEIPISGASLDSLSSSSSVDSVECFLQEKDKDIQLLVKSSSPSRSSLSEVVSLLEQPLLGDPERRPAQKKDPYYGADWGMRWWTAVAIMLVVGIVTPVFYLLYYEVLMKADVRHHTTIDSIRPGPTQPAFVKPIILPKPVLPLT